MVLRIGHGTFDRGVIALRKCRAGNQEQRKQQPTHRLIPPSKSPPLEPTKLTASSRSSNCRNGHFDTQFLEGIRDTGARVLSEGLNRGKGQRAITKKY